MIRVVVTQSAFSPEGEASRFTEALDETVGAIVSFIGLCRARSAAGEPVAKMELDHYPGFTESELERLTQTVANKHAVAEALVVHRAGIVSPGEAIVLVAVASAHRAAVRRRGIDGSLEDRRAVLETRRPRQRIRLIE